MRGFLRLLTVLLGLAFAAAGAALTLEVGRHWWRPTEGPLLVPWPAWRARLTELTWQSTEARLTAGIVIAAGLVLLLVALAARRRSIPLHDPAPGVSVTTSPRFLARVIGQRVRAEDAVTRASVTASRKKVRVRATSRMQTEGDLRPHLITVVTELLDDLPLRRKPAVSVIVDSPKDRP